MIKIKGGPKSTGIKVYNVSDDGSETEVKGIVSIEINRIVPGSLVIADIKILNIELDMEVEVK